ncbi:uncharacterized protein [Blastocystis hominis]|uniref:Metallo-beta-lactamase domain-containing protein n=1 Tax=Blastocystis hominis TaxID=12968 RepID=D8M7K5_BLAHO|nr:uncharacterized protein [Blastocystis hominis]CBK24044.2 unnamed protein product [Blastocystis hominis]|eukprot:XP_012898092.1 uncharacterized protein [Blastocystis hominis]
MERKEMGIIYEQGVEKEKFNVDNILHVFLVPNGDKKENAYILCDREEVDGALIDPGTNEYKLIRALEDYRVNITKVFITHAHEGHVKCIQELLHDIGDLTIYLNEADRPLFDSIVAKGLTAEDEMQIKYLKHMDEVAVGSHKGKVYHTPGHTPGSLCYHFGNFLFTGDTLMCNKVGETTAEGSDLELMKKSIKELILPLRKETMILPGHGPFSSVGTEALFNPVVGKKGNQ